MFVLIIQTILLFAIAFILGCIIGCLLRRLFGVAEVETPAVATGTAALGAGAAAVALKTPVPPKTPDVPKPPMPVAPKPAPVATPKPVAPPLVPTAPPVPEPPKPEPPKLEPVKAPEPEEAKPVPVAPLVSKPEPKSPPEKPAPKPAVPKPAVQTRDNLKLVRGIGPQNEGRLNALGVFRFEQIAKWTAKDEAHFGDVLAFPGRIEREGWVEQAKVLAAGGTTEFAGRVKSGEVDSSVGKADAGEMGTKPKTLSAARGGKADNLTLIDGVGNAIEKKMFKMGIYHFDQVAEMTKDELTWLGNAVGFPGRPERENWAGESKILGAGGTTDHAKRVERGEIKTSRKTDDD